MNLLNNEHELLILGEQFARLSNNRTIISYQEFEGFFNRVISDTKKYHVYFGQGLSDTQINYLNNKMSTLSACFEITGQIPFIKRAPESYTNTHNILSDPKKINEATYQSYLMLDSSNKKPPSNPNDSCRINNMTMIKASHQLLAIVSKKYFSSNQLTKDKTFIFNPMQSNFYDCIYPVDLALLLKIETYRQGLDSNFKAVGEINFIQNSEIIGHLSAEFGLLNTDILMDIQKELTLSSLKKTFKTNPIKFTGQNAA